MSADEQLEAAYAAYGRAIWVRERISEAMIAHYDREPKHISFADTYEMADRMAAAMAMHQKATIDLRALGGAADLTIAGLRAALEELEANRFVSAVAAGDIR